MIFNTSQGGKGRRRARGVAITKEVAPRIPRRTSLSFERLIIAPTKAWVSAEIRMRYNAKI